MIRSDLYNLILERLGWHGVCDSKEIAEDITDKGMGLMKKEQNNSLESKANEEYEEWVKRNRLGDQMNKNNEYTPQTVTANGFSTLYRALKTAKEAMEFCIRKANGDCVDETYWMHDIDQIDKLIKMMEIQEVSTVGELEREFYRANCFGTMEVEADKKIDCGDTLYWAKDGKVTDDADSDY